MKKILLISFCSLLLSACEKEFTCECTTTVTTSNGTTTNTTQNTIEERKRSDAEASCNGLQANNTSANGMQSSASCKLK